MAVGAKADGNAIKDFIKNKWGNIEVDDNLRTSIKKSICWWRYYRRKSNSSFCGKSRKRCSIYNY